MESATNSLRSSSFSPRFLIPRWTGRQMSGALPGSWDHVRPGAWRNARRKYRSEVLLVLKLLQFESGCGKDFTNPTSSLLHFPREGSLHRRLRHLCRLRNPRDIWSSCLSSPTLKISGILELLRKWIRYWRLRRWRGRSSMLTFILFLQIRF